jgi:hypothetical protein
MVTPLLASTLFLAHVIGFEPGLGHVVSCYNMALRLSSLLHLTMLHTPLHVGHDLGMTAESFLDLGYDMVLLPSTRYTLIPYCMV